MSYNFVVDGMSFAFKTTKIDAEAMNQKTEQLASMILNYLRRNPNAADTLEGIAMWWLGFEKIESSVEDVANILENLVQQGIIERLIPDKQEKDGKSVCIYRLRDSKRQDTARCTAELKD